MIAMSLLNTLQFESPLHKVFSSNTLGGGPIRVQDPIDTLNPIGPQAIECCCEKDYLCIFNYLIKHQKNPPPCPCGQSKIRRQKVCPCGSEGCPCGGEGCPCGGEGCPKDEPPCKDEEEDEGEGDDASQDDGETGEEDSDSLDCNISQGSWGAWSDCVSDDSESGGTQTREMEVTHYTDDGRCAQEVSDYCESLLDAWRTEGRDVDSVGWWQPSDLLASGNQYWQSIYEHRPCDFVEDDEGEEDGESDDTEEAEVQEEEISGSNDGPVIQASGIIGPYLP